MNDNDFASLYSFTLTNPCIHTSDELTKVALMIYATYTVTNRLRHGSGPYFTTTDAYDALVQAVREGSKGHNKAMTALRGRWYGVTLSDRIPPRPTTPSRTK